MYSDFHFNDHKPSVFASKTVSSTPENRAKSPSFPKNTQKSPTNLNKSEQSINIVKLPILIPDNETISNIDLQDSFKRYGGSKSRKPPKNKSVELTNRFKDLAVEDDEIEPMTDGNWK